MTININIVAVAVFIIGQSLNQGLKRILKKMTTTYNAFKCKIHRKLLVSCLVIHLQLLLLFQADIYQQQAMLGINKEILNKKKIKILHLVTQLSC